MMVVMGQTGPGGGPDLGLVDALLESGASPDLQDGAAGKVTPIMAAIRGGHREVALRLVKSSKNVGVAAGGAGRLMLPQRVLGLSHSFLAAESCYVLASFACTGQLTQPACRANGHDGPQGQGTEFPQYIVP